MGAFQSLSKAVSVPAISLREFLANVFSQWSVVFTGLAATLVFWAVTPLIGAVFTTANVTTTSVRNATTHMALPPVSKQARELTTGFMMRAYNEMWLNENPPQFSTKDAALLPFALDTIEGERSTSDLHTPYALSANDSWTATTTKYSTTLDCRPAIAIGNSSNLTYDNGQGCATNFGGANLEYSYSTVDVTALYVGYWMGPFNDYYLSGMECPSSVGQHTFLAIWNVLSDGRRNTTALFCETTYSHQLVNVTILATNMTVIDVVPLEPAMSLSDEVFNITNFEYILNTGSPVVSRRADIVDTTILVDQKSRLRKMGFSPNSTTTNMVGFALGTTQLNLSDYANATILAASFEKAHQLLFSRAVQSLLSNETVDPHPRLGVLSYHRRAIKVVRPLALAVEIILGVVTALTLGLLLQNLTRASELTCDPASLRDIIGMQDSSVAASTLRRGSGSRRRATSASLKHGQIRICNLAATNEARNQTRSNHQRSWMHRNPGTFYDERFKTDFRPWYTKLWAISTFTVFLIVMLVLQVDLNTISTNVHGLKLPLKNTVITQILTSYLPVILGTIIELYWTLLSRSQCVLQPFEALMRGISCPSRSLDLRYTSLPPQLAFVRAFRARHWLLVAVCMIELSANLLKVSLSGFFFVDNAEIESNMTFVLERLPKFEHIYDASSGDMWPDSSVFYVAASNISNSSLLPPWTSKDTFFAPFMSTKASTAFQDYTYKGNTQGFGISVACTEIQHNTAAYIKAGSDETRAPQVRLGDGQMCNDHTVGPTNGQNNVYSALEVFHALGRPDDSNVGGVNECDNLILAGLLRGNLSVSANNFKTDNPDSSEDPTSVLAINALSALWMVCKPTLHVAPYEVNVGQDGRVKDAVRRGPYSSDLASYFTPNLNLTHFMNQTNRIFNEGDDTSAGWHSDSYVNTWFGYLIKMLDRGSGVTDPHRPVPSFAEAAPLIEEIYKRVFAIQLGINTDWLASAKQGDTMSGSVFIPQERLFISQPAFVTCIVLMSLNILVATAYNLYSPKMMPFRMPKTIADILELFDGSSLVAEAYRRGGPREDCMLGYGKFVGTDGKTHEGIERSSLLMEHSGPASENHC